MQINFEQFLEDTFLEDLPQPLDDNITDKFNDWLGRLEISELIDFGQDYAEVVYQGVINKLSK